MKKLLITRPNFDPGTSYLFEWSKEIIKEAFCTAKEIVEDREEEDRPERLVKRALSAVQSIKPSSKLKEPAVRGLLNKLLAEVSRLLSA